MLRVAVFVFLMLYSCVAAEVKTVHICNWSDYVALDLLKRFTAETEIKVVYSIYNSNTELGEMLKAGEKCDVIFPSASYLPTLIANNLVQKIDTAKIPNSKNIDKSLLKNDLIKEYGIVYFWGGSGIVKLKNTPFAIERWSDLWDEKYKNALFLYRDFTDLLAISLRVLGIDPNTKNPKEIQKGYEKLLRLTNNIKGFYEDAEQLRINLINNNAKAAIVYSGDAKQMNGERDNFVYIYPKEGSIFWTDVMAITASAENLQEAYSFINFLSDKKIMEQNGEYLGYDLPSVQPDKDAMENAIFLQNSEEAETMRKKYEETFFSLFTKQGVDR